MSEEANRKRPVGNRVAKWPMTSRDTYEGQGRDPNTLRVLHLENGWRCYLATIANYYRYSAVMQCEVGCEVGYLSDILASLYTAYCV